MVVIIEVVFGSIGTSSTTYRGITGTGMLCVCAICASLLLMNV